MWSFLSLFHVLGTHNQESINLDFIAVTSISIQKSFAISFALSFFSRTIFFPYFLTFSFFWIAVSSLVFFQFITALSKVLLVQKRSGIYNQEIFLY